MTVEMVSFQAPEACRWSHSITVSVEGKEYEVQFLSDDEGVEDDNITIFLDGEQISWGGDGNVHESAIDEIYDFVRTEYKFEV